MQYITKNRYLNNKYLIESIGFLILFIGLVEPNMCNLTNIRTHWFPLASLLATLGTITAFLVDLRGDRKNAERLFFISLFILVVGKLKDLVFASKEVFRGELVDTTTGIGITIILVFAIIAFMVYATFYDNK